MTRPVQAVLTTLDRLSPQEQHQAAVEILRRVEPVVAEPAMELLSRLADVLFESMDVAEAAERARHRN